MASGYAAAFTEMRRRQQSTGADNLQQLQQQSTPPRSSKRAQLGEEVEVWCPSCYARANHDIFSSLVRSAS
jgi:hypothetical protein